MRHDQAAEDEIHESAVKSKYLIFTLCGELYGSALLQIKEVIKMTSIKPVPHAEKYFRGVINLRGQIISVMDLRTKFQMVGHNPEQGLILIIEGDRGLVGAIVDTIEFVREIPPESIQAGDAIETRIPRDQFIGVARSSEQLIHLIDLIKSVAVFQSSGTTSNLVNQKGAA
jgi:purine-binding chemotaxis protein CheW